MSDVLCVTAKLDCQCPLWVKSGHRNASEQCLLYPQKRTLRSATGMSALCQKQIFCAAERSPLYLNSNAHSRNQSLVDARDSSFQSAPCFCQFIRI